MPDDSHSATGPQGAAQPQGEGVEHYLIAPRNAADPGQLQELQQCRAVIEQTPSSRISGSSTMLKAQIRPSLAQEIRQRFGASLIIEKDAPLPDPRLMPDFKP